jgi:GT2 family glycosyltransferase
MCLVRFSAELPAVEGGVDVVVVTYGADDQVRHCLASLHGLPGTLVVVDNGGSEVARSLAERAGALYARPTRNIGFAAAVNRAIQLLEGSGRDVLLLNPDAQIGVAQIHRLQQELLRQPQTAAVAPQLRNADGSPQRTLWPMPSPVRVWLGVFGLAERFKHRQFVSGAVLLLSLAALREVGLFDERFFLYSEESDWQMRALRRGWTLRVAEDVIVTHTGSGSSADELVRLRLFHASAELFVRKWYGRLGWYVFRAGAVASALRRMLTASSKQDRQAARQTARLYVHGPASQLPALTRAAA